MRLASMDQSLERKKVALRILNLGMDTENPTGKLMLTVLAGVAQFEREIMLERQREGVAKAKAAGKYKGRKPIASDLQQEVIRFVENSKSKVNIAKDLGIGEATIYRILKNQDSKDQIKKAREKNHRYNKLIDIYTFDIIKSITCNVFG